MPEKEERTFYLYSDGYMPQELALGHLVFGTYVRPTKGRQCPMEPVSEADLGQWTNVQLRSNFCSSSHSLRGFGVSATALDLVTIGLSMAREVEHAVASKQCRRITLKSPKSFLSEKVLAVDSTKETVQEWLSISSLCAVKRKLTPEGWRSGIWMLTGLYELDDCTSFSWHKGDVSAEVSVAAEIMELLNIPFGAAAHVERSHGRYTKQTFVGKSIWAAEYQLVDAKFTHVPSREPPAQLQLPLRLKAIYSGEGWREKKKEEEEKTKEERDNMAVLDLTDEFSSGRGDTLENEEEFWKQYEEAEEDWMVGIDIDKWWRWA